MPLVAGLLLEGWKWLEIGLVEERGTLLVVYSLLMKRRVQ